MPRTERKLSKTGIYHVMLRGINKQIIFEEPADIYKFLSLLAEVKQWTKGDVPCVLQSKHV